VTDYGLCYTFNSEQHLNTSKTGLTTAVYQRRANNFYRAIELAGWSWSPSFSYHYLPFRPFPLEVGPLIPASGVGSAVISSSISRSGVKRPPKSNLLHFSFKIWHLVAAILMIFLVWKYFLTLKWKILILCSVLGCHRHFIILGESTDTPATPVPASLYSVE